MDSSRALLEAVAVAGLVGVVRQLGDLAGFAAELFQGFQEEMKEVLGQSHRLKARVLRLEAELPLVQKELLSETNLTCYAYSQGYVSSDVDRSVLNKVLRVLVHLKHWLPQV